MKIGSEPLTLVLLNFPPAVIFALLGGKGMFFEFIILDYIYCLCVCYFVKDLIIFNNYISLFIKSLCISAINIVAIYFIVGAGNWIVWLMTYLRY